MAQLVVASVDKANQIPRTDVIHLPLRGMMVMMFGECKANTILVLLIRSMPFSPNMQVTLANGHCKATFASIKLLLY
jgi:hypothetical protein